MPESASTCTLLARGILDQPPYGERAHTNQAVKFIPRVSRPPGGRGQITGPSGQVTAWRGCLILYETPASGNKPDEEPRQRTAAVFAAGRALRGGRRDAALLGVAFVVPVGAAQARPSRWRRAMKPPASARGDWRRVCADGAGAFAGYCRGRNGVL